MKLNTKHLLTITNLNKTEILSLIKRAIELKNGWSTGYRPWPLIDKIVALIFEKASTRTRVSFEVAIKQLGGSTIFLTNKDSQLKNNEPIKDMARVMNRYVDALIVRTFQHEIIEELAAQSSIPVINALTDYNHPCQVLSDLLTVSESLNNIEQLLYAWLGDGNNMAHSWLEATGVLGLKLHMACPHGFLPSQTIIEQMRHIGGEITITNDPKKAITGAQVISTDVWTSMGQETELHIRKKTFTNYTLNMTLLKLAAPEAIVLHCLPAHRGEEISEEVLEGAQSMIWNQAENRLHMQKAILEALLG